MTPIQISPLNSRFGKKPHLRNPSPALPVFSNGHDKHATRRFSWTTTYYVQLPWPFSRRRTGVRHLKLNIPIPTTISSYAVRLRQFYPQTCRVFVAVILIALFFTVRGMFMAPKPPTTRLVFSRDDLRRIWEWEVASGHYQSSRKSEFCFVFQISGSCSRLV